MGNYLYANWSHNKDLYTDRHTIVTDSQMILRHQHDYRNSLLQ